MFCHLKWPESFTLYNLWIVKFFSNDAFSIIENSIWESSGQTKSSVSDFNYIFIVLGHDRRCGALALIILDGFDVSLTTNFRLNNSDS